jgi:hypothetical protein
MIRIAISQAAFEAIAATLKLGSVGFENKTDEQWPEIDLARPGCGGSAQGAAGTGERVSAPAGR